MQKSSSGKKPAAVPHSMERRHNPEWEVEEGYLRVQVLSGNYHVSERPKEVLVTVLGSCVSACIRDPLLGIGGMNHFLLPVSHDQDISAPLRFGAYAMEQLINELLKRGADKQRLEIKLFGGASVLESMSIAIGCKNVDFVRRFLKSESLSVAAEDLGGDYPRRIHYYPDTGRVRMRKLRRLEDRRVVDQESAYLAQLNRSLPEGDVELFT